MSKPKSPARLSAGCGYLLVVTAIACLLLVFNSLLVHAGLFAYQEYGPRELTEPRAQQAIQVVAPVLLIFMEYWLFDWFVDHLASRQPK